jgi:hypothetical protein
MVAAALVLTLIAACALGVLAVQRGAVHPIGFDGRLGSLRLVGYSTWNANCPPFVGCEPTRREAYVIWLLRAPPGAAGDRAPYRLLDLPIEHRR